MVAVQKKIVERRLKARAVLALILQLIWRNIHTLAARVAGSPTRLPAQPALRAIGARAPIYDLVHTIRNVVHHTLPRSIHPRDEILLTANHPLHTYITRTWCVPHPKRCDSAYIDIYHGGRYHAPEISASPKCRTGAVKTLLVMQDYGQ